MTEGADDLRPLADGPWAGWLMWPEAETGAFADAIGASYSRADGPGRAIVMVPTARRHANKLGGLHGGLIAAFADQACFAALRAMGRPEQANAVTVDLHTQFCAAGVIGQNVRAEVELLRETGRLLFMRLTLFQEDRLVATSAATLRKAAETR